jgi:hypothetical protein
MDSETLRNELLTSQWYGISPGNISYTSGNVGIGTNNPVYTLDVNGTGRFAAGTLTVPTILATTTVGINTTVSPGTTPLQVFWNSSKNTTGWALAVGDTTGYNNGNSSPVLLSVLYNAVATGQGVVQQFGKGGANSLFTSYQYNSGGTDKIGWTWFGVGPYTQLCMLATGNVGIGSSAPTEKLDVAGNTTVSGVMKNPGRPLSLVGKNNADVTSGIMIFNSVGYNVGSMYNSTTGYWTASVAGYYQFTYSGISRYGSVAPNMRWYKNGGDFGWGASHYNMTYNTASGPLHLQMSCSVIIYLAVNDNVYFNVVGDGFYGTNTIHNSACCIFLG